MNKANLVAIVLCMIMANLRAEALQPYTGIVSMDEKGTIQVAYRGRRLTTGLHPVLKAQRGGGLELEMVNEMYVEDFTANTRLDANTLQAMDVKGNRIAPAALRKLFKASPSVLISANGQAVDPSYLNDAAPGTVVLILPKGESGTNVISNPPIDPYAAEKPSDNPPIDPYAPRKLSDNPPIDPYAAEKPPDNPPIDPYAPAKTVQPTTPIQPVQPAQPSTPFQPLPPVPPAPPKPPAPPVPPAPPPPPAVQPAQPEPVKLYSAATGETIAMYTTNGKNSWVVWQLNDKGVFTPVRYSQTNSDPTYFYLTNDAKTGMLAIPDAGGAALWSTDGQKWNSWITVERKK